MSTILQYGEDGCEVGENINKLETRNTTGTHKDKGELTLGRPPFLM